MRFNPAAREVICKIVYYGPGLAGKTTNMQVVHDSNPPQQVSELVSVDTHSERTLHFDWLALEVGQVQGVNVRFEFFTVPGQNYYAATRRQVLAAADGVVFIADSRREALDENIDSMNEMLNNLRHHGLPEDLPVVMQYNKQDMATALKREQLEPLMNVRGWPSFSATATRKDGVIETVRAITALVAERMATQQVPAAEAGPQSPSSPGQPQTWLISCYRCQTILEVPDASIGAAYTCGVCGSTLEVFDTDRGLTRAPSAREDDSGGYALQNSALPEQGASALGVRTAPIEKPAAVAEGGDAGFELDGYDIVATLDESVQGRRLRVRERASGRTMRALTISTQLMRQPGYKENLEPYVRMAGPIKHPNALSLANLRPTADSAVMLSVDPPDHEPLSHVLARRRALAPPHAMGLLRQLALALEEAARHGVVHGWLRPDVVLVSPDGNALVDELCLPKNHKFLVRELAGASAATEYYLAPEHLNDDARSDLRSDIFALGALLFRMITGEGLVTGYSAHEALHKVVANGPRPLRTTQAGVSRDLDLFYQRLVATERKDRFQNYREVIDALDKFGGGAKRQTLRLTGTVANTSGTGRTGRSTANAHIARRAGGSGNYAGRPRPAGSQPSTGTNRKSNDSGIVVGVVVVCVLAAVIFIVVMMSGRSTSSWNPPPKPEPTTSAKPQPTVERPIYNPPAGLIPIVKPTPKIVPTPDPAVVKPPTQSRAEILHQIADYRTEERFQVALAAAQKLESVEERDSLVKAITAQHDQRKHDLEIVAANNSDSELIRKLLAPAMTTWGLPGDSDWAAAQIAKSEKAVVEGPAAVDPAAEIRKPPTGELSPVTGQPLAVQPQNPATQSDPRPVPATPSVKDPITQANGLIDQALIANQPTAAQQALSGVDAQLPETRALKRKVDLWTRRAALINRVVPLAKAKLRLPNPSGDPWDVLGCDATSVDVSSPSGTRTTLPWNQFGAKDIAKVFMDAVNAGDGSSDEHATAIVMLLLAGDQVMANVQARKAKGILDPEVAADVDTLLNLQKRRELADLITKGNDAVKAGNAKALNDTLTEIRKADKGSQTAFAAQIAHLEESVAKIVTTRAVPTTVGKDRVLFEMQDDLLSFPDIDGKWQVNSGVVANLTDGARLGRRDLGGAKSMSMRFQTSQNKGALTVEFRGAKVAMDLAASTYSVSGKAQGRTKGFNFIAKLPYTLLIERKDDTHTTIQFNNGVETAEVVVGDLSDAMTVSVDAGASVSIDEIEIFRETKVAPVNAKAAFKVIGWDPLGLAYMEPPAIVLPSNPGDPSGIATAIKDNVAGYTFEVKGIGSLRIQLGRQSEKDSKWVTLTIDLPKVPQEVKALSVRWTDKAISVYDGKGIELATQPIAERYTHLMISATNQATLIGTPRIEFKAP
ncbi:MAG: protein kinase [Planctomycetes bacterium]|nr:protein kinase [Planctomycetota bacterium]